jgi:hypothetical protein
LPVHVDLAQFPRLACRRCGLVALVDPSLPLDEHASLTCPRCRGHLARPRISPTNLPDEPPAESRRHPVLPAQAPVPSSAAVGLAIAAIFLAVLFAFFLFLMLTPHTAHINPYHPAP